MAREKVGCVGNVIHKEVVEQVQDKLPPEQEFVKLAGFFKVFGDVTRTKIIWALFEREMCVCDLAALLSMTKSAISHQLAFLRSYNLVTFRREGKVVYYSLSDDHIKHIFLCGREHINE